MLLEPEARDWMLATLWFPDPACSAWMPLAGRQRTPGAGPEKQVRLGGAEGWKDSAGGAGCGLWEWPASAPGCPEHRERSQKVGILA